MTRRMKLTLGAVDGATLHTQLRVPPSRTRPPSGRLHGAPTPLPIATGRSTRAREIPSEAALCVVRELLQDATVASRASFITAASQVDQVSLETPKLADPTPHVPEVFV